MSDGGNKAHDKEKKKKYEICGAKNKKGGICSRPAGWGTSHSGSGKCKLHGGASTGPRNPDKLKGNKNAEKTGQFSSIVFDALEDDEKILINQVDLDVARQIDNEIALLEVRERRILKRLNAINNNPVIIEYQKKHGIDGDKMVEMMTENFKSTINFVQSVENALTQVQDKKTKLLELKFKISEGIDNEETFDAKAYVENLDKSLDKIWDDNKGDDEDGSEKEENNK